MIYPDAMKILLLYILTLDWSDYIEKIYLKE